MARRNPVDRPSALQHQQWSWVLGVMVGLQQKYGLGGVVEVAELVLQKRLVHDLKQGSRQRMRPAQVQE